MKAGEVVTITTDHAKDTSIALSARRAGFLVETSKVIITNTKLETNQAVTIKLLNEFNQALKDSHKC